MQKEILFGGKFPWYPNVKSLTNSYGNYILGINADVKK